MVGELERIEERSKRWRFSLGCLGAALLVPPRRTDSGRLVVGLVAAAAAGCVGLTSYGLVRYPAVLASHGTWLALTAFGAVLACLSLTMAIIVRRGAAGPVGLDQQAAWPSPLYGFWSVSLSYPTRRRRRPPCCWPCHWRS